MLGQSMSIIFEDKDDEGIGHVHATSKIKAFLEAECVDETPYYMHKNKKYHERYLRS